MTTNQKDPVLVVLQLSGGNDYLNTVIPYTDPIYRDSRPAVAIPEDQVLGIDGGLGLHPSMGPASCSGPSSNSHSVRSGGVIAPPPPITASGVYNSDKGRATGLLEVWRSHPPHRPRKMMQPAPTDAARIFFMMGRFYTRGKQR